MNIQKRLTRLHNALIGLVDCNDIDGLRAMEENIIAESQLPERDKAAMIEAIRTLIAELEHTPDQLPS